METIQECCKTMKLTGLSEYLSEKFIFQLSGEIMVLHHFAAYFFTYFATVSNSIVLSACFYYFQAMYQKMLNPDDSVNIPGALHELPSVLMVSQKSQLLVTSLCSKGCSHNLHCFFAQTCEGDSNTLGDSISALRLLKFFVLFMSVNRLLQADLLKMCISFYGNKRGHFFVHILTVYNSDVNQKVTLCVS